MSIYQLRLPEVFPYMYIVRRSTALEWAEFLSRSDKECSCGSSFAITSDTLEGDSRKFWLSNVSVSRLVDADMLELAKS